MFHGIEILHRKSRTLVQLMAEGGDVSRHGDIASREPQRGLMAEWGRIFPSHMARFLHSIAQ